jgi:hypothetical protein
VKRNCGAVDKATNNTTELTGSLYSVNDTSAAAYRQSLVLLSVFLVCFDD